MRTFERKIKYEQEVKRDFARQVAETSWGKEILDCIQCGGCSGICPTAPYMEHPPRKIIAMVREGMKDEVLQSFTIWLCASCYACMVSCPQGIKITEVMYGLKRMAIEEGVYPKRFPIPTLARDFFALAKDRGRISEFWLAGKLMIKSGIGKCWSYLPIGLELLKTRRVSFQRETISPEGRRQIQALLETKEGIQ